MNPHTHQHTASKKQPATNHHTVLNRRTLLTGSTLISLSTLLTACTQQAAHEAASTETPTIASGESATASSTSASATTSPTPSPVVTRGYSGGSKAPEGEYRKADGYGPAQNVPKPPKRQQYPETEEGLTSMMTDWVAAHNYAIQTGDCAEAFKYVEKTSKEYPFYEYIEGLYQRGGWVIEGLDSYQQESLLVYNEEKKIYRMRFRRFWDIAMYIEPDGKITKKANTDTTNDKFNYFFKYSDGYWVIYGSGKQEWFEGE